MNKKTLLLLDTSALIYRSYHALPPLTTKDGEIVNAVYGVATTILSVTKELSPDYIIAAFDTGKPTFRNEMYNRYKATRKETPDDLKSQFGRVQELVEAFGIETMQKDGYEADDVIGTIAYQIEKNHKDINVIIVTGDNDALQLVTDHVHVRTFGRGLSDVKMYNMDAVKEKYGISPKQLVDYKGLAGDSSDNIPGVTGVGAVTATKLLKEYNTLEEIYENVNNLKGAVKIKLERDKAQAFLSRDLGRIKTDVDIKLDIKNARVDFGKSSIRDFLREMNFYSLIKRLPFDDINEKVKLSDSTNKYTVVSEEKTEKVLEKLSLNQNISFSYAEDIDGSITGFAFCAAVGEVVFIERTRKIETLLKQFFKKRHNAELVIFDLKKAIHKLDAIGIAINPPYMDVLLQAYVLNAGSRITFEEQALRVLGEEIKEETETQLELIPDRKRMQNDVMRKTDITLQMSLQNTKDIKKISKTQKEKTIETLLETIELPLVSVLVSIEKEGIRCDGAILNKFSGELQEKIKDLERAIHDHAGEVFNVNSTKQLRVILFEKLQLPTKTIKKNKTGYSTAVAELDKLQGTHEIINNIKSYRELFKLQTTYVSALPKLIARDGRIHSTFQQHVTATGRLSSINPNLQNIPTRTEYATKIRKAFLARDGYKLLSADYSQIELRCVAHIAQDKKMIEAFLRGEDIHTRTAAEVFGVDSNDVTKVMRRNAKALNFGLIYGMGEYGFAQSAQISTQEAHEFIEKYFNRFNGVEQYMKQTILIAQKQNYVETLFGRRRAVPEIHSPNKQLARTGERMAINMPIQGTAADIMKLAMIAVDEKICKKYGDDVSIVLQVHDEIICEICEEKVEMISKEIKEIMESVVRLSVPLTVDTVYGDTWAELK